MDIVGYASFTIEAIFKKKMFTNLHILSLTHIDVNNRISWQLGVRIYFYPGLIHETFITIVNLNSVSVRHEWPYHICMECKLVDNIWNTLQMWNYITRNKPTVVSITPLYSYSMSVHLLAEFHSEYRICSKSDGGSNILFYHQLTLANSYLLTIHSPASVVFHLSQWNTE